MRCHNLDPLRAFIAIDTRRLTMMRSITAFALAAILVAPLPASAQNYHDHGPHYDHGHDHYDHGHDHYDHGPDHHGGNTGAVVGGAILGLGVGALIGGALASSQPAYRAPPPVYYAPPPGYYAPPPPVYSGY
jgi:hypothetical protein